MKYIALFVITFVFNVVWENLHSALYIHYQNGPITNFVLLRASLIDTVIIVSVILFLMFLPAKIRILSMIILLIMIALGIEYWALATGRWAYTSAMPIIPFFQTGLTPTIQLVSLGFLSYFVSLALIRH